MTAPAPNKEAILVVDDAPETLEVLRRNLESEGYRVSTASGVAEDLAVLKATPIDLVITDFKMPKVSGLDLVRHVRENLKDTEVVMITGYASIEGAIEAIKTGAEEYLSKPFTDEELFEAVRRALEKRSRRRVGTPAASAAVSPLPGFIGQSEAIQRVYVAIRKAAETTATVLITGESGTGKELVARAIHYSSRRSAVPFVAVNCGGIPAGEHRPAGSGDGRRGGNRRPEPSRFYAFLRTSPRQCSPLPRRGRGRARACRPGRRRQ
jgi:DNA-binding NtrC family response regulator